jgi:two-component system sensor histidine kinase GlrK
LQKLIEDLLNYHQTRAIETQPSGPVRLSDTVRRVIREHKLAAFARMVTFDARLKPVFVIGHAERIRTIVDNLVSNAIKYSPRSGVIRLELGVQQDFAVLDVIDQGRGVDPNERERIFESFYQGKAPTEGRVKGSGLGLAIAREYALAQGGRVEVRERADAARGADFRLWLPLASAAEAEAALVADSDSRSRPVRIAGAK